MHEFIIIGSIRARDNSNVVKQQDGNQWNEEISIYSCQERVRISHEQRIPSELLNTS